MRECKYGDLVYSCGSTLATDVWACRRPNPDCPAAKPAPGTTCAGQVTCNDSGARLRMRRDVDLPLIGRGARPGGG